MTPEQIEAIKESFDTYLAESEAHQLSGKERLLRDMLLDHLAATGRLLPEGFVAVDATEYQQLKNIQNALHAHINLAEIAAAKKG